MTQKQLSEKLYVARSTISSWEVGRTYPDIETLIQISELFSVSFDYLLGQDLQYLKAIDQDIKEGRNLKKKFKRWFIGMAVIFVVSLVFVISNVTLTHTNPLVTGAFLLIKKDFYLVVFLSFLCGIIVAGLILALSKKKLSDSPRENN